MASTRIEWTDTAWNPITGCTRVSPGCKNCYAERMAHRLAGRCGYPPAPDQFRVTLHPEKLNEPFRWRKPRMVFVDSMGDLFHEEVPNTYILQVFLVMAQASQHTFQVLTKRAERMMQWMNTFPEHIIAKPPVWPLPNVWLGVTAENQTCADERIPLLLRTPAAVRFASVEPMLGPMAIGNHLKIALPNGTPAFSYRQGIKQALDWVIVGCESGPNARETNLNWVREIRLQCTVSHTPLFIKQLKQDGKLIKMPALDGQVWAQTPEVRYD